MDDTICANNLIYTLSGTVPVTGLWSVVPGGDGTFTTDTDMNGTYTAGQGDTTAGNVIIVLTSTSNGACAAATDTMLLEIGPGIFVEAGPAQTICANIIDVNLTGSVAGGTTNTGIWTSSNGDGTFDSDVSLTTIYHPSAADIANGTTTLYLTSTNNVACNPVVDSLVLTVNTAIVVNGGGTATVCANNPTVALGGAVSGFTTSGLWSVVPGGDGTFSDPLTVIANNYTPGALDTAAGTIDVILESTNMGACNVVTDTVRITITDAPFFNPIATITVCADTTSVAVIATQNNVATAWSWSASSVDGTFSSTTALATNYIPSATDTTNGSVVLSITTTAQGTCLPITESMTLSITDAPFINPGNDISVCASNPTANLLATSNAAATQWVWSTSTNLVPGTFSTTTALATTYTPSDADTAAGSVFIVFSSTAQGSCNPVTDSLELTITDAVYADAGAAQTICANMPEVYLTGSFTLASGATWSSLGDGSFSSFIDMNASYFPGDADTTAGFVELVLATFGNGSCATGKDTVEITILPGIFVNAGNDKSMCANEDSTEFFGAVNGGTTNTGVWTTALGTGTFSMPTVLNSFYQPSNQDTTNGNVTLTLTSTNNGVCPAVQDSIILSINPPILVDAGVPFDICGNNATGTLVGNVSGAGGGAWSTTFGTGTFTNSTQLTASYAANNQDILAGSVIITLSSTGNGVCNEVKDSTVMTIID